MIITFTCPHCGGHQLQQIRQAIHRTEVKITTALNGMLTDTPIGVVEELRGPVLGYRCRKCRYPDIQNHDVCGGFFWNTPEDVHAAGCLTITSEHHAPHRCMICRKDGTMEPIIVESPTSGTLSPDERNIILTRRGIKKGVLLCETDAGIGAFSCTDWEGVEREIL